MINDIFSYLIKYISNLRLVFNWSDFIQIAFLVCLLMFLYKKFIKNTSSEKFVKGVLILFCVWNSSKPKSAKQAGIGALVSVILNLVVLVPCIICSIGSMGSGV